MKLPKPGVFAVRAINQYRRRDVLSYLGLRYYLDNAAARSDIWATNVAVDQVLRRTDPLYFSTYHFKDVDSNDHITHREMMLPSPSESITEAVLINECSVIGGTFKTADCVYSYQPSSGNNTEGIFLNYMHGLKERHSAISQACQENKKCRVGFFDIKRFYPSVKYDIALKAWKSACDSNALGASYTEIGEKLLYDHSKVNNENSILTGPMFSHLIGNLILRNIDNRLQQGKSRYIRYVDDVALIGSEKDIHDSFQLMNKMLIDLGLELHDETSPKSLNISGEDWLVGDHDYSDSFTECSWMTLIVDLKQLLLWHPEKIPMLKEKLLSEGFRIPLLDYSAVINESHYVYRQWQLFQRKWFRKQLNHKDIDNILLQARYLREKYSRELNTIISDLSIATGFHAKRLLPKARYRLGRLSYLAEPSKLTEISLLAKTIPALYFQSEVAAAVGTGNINRIIRLGSNAAQAAAQPLRMSQTSITLSTSPVSDPEIQSLGMFALNGIEIESTADVKIKETDFLKFATGNIDKSLFKSTDAFVKDIACLHGLSAGKPCRHADVLNSAFHQAEDITLDAIEQSRQSLSL